MKCINPTLCYTNILGKKVYRSFNLADSYYKKNSQQVFNCGKCLSCRKKKAYELAARCVLHASLYKENMFLTLTYDEKKENYHNEFDYTDIQKFKKRLRAHFSREDGRRIEIFNVHEYGRMGKKHWHLLVFGADFRDRRIYTKRNNIPLYTSELLSNLWKAGHHTIGDVSEGSAMYQAQYMEKDFKNRNESSRNRKSHSKHSGLGRPYFEKHYKQLLRLGYIPFQGGKMPLPRYFEKLAHKHYSHFYEKHNFFDQILGKKLIKKALYRPFKIGQENKEIADLYIQYREQKKEKILDLEKEWENVISQHLTTKLPPDFILSGENALYDLRNKTSQERF